MKEINKHNYESYYLDFLEGQLSNPQKIELLAFLELNPELLVEDLPALNPISTTLNSAFKEGLKKSNDQTNINELNVEGFIIAYHEKQLSKRQIDALRSFLDLNEFWQKEFKIYGFTKTSADLTLVYPDKSKLKRTKILAIKPILITIAVAATIVSAFFFFNFDHNQLPEKYANTVRSPLNAPALTPKNSSLRPENIPLVSVPNKSTQFVSKGAETKSLSTIGDLPLIETASLLTHVDLRIPNNSFVTKPKDQVSENSIDFTMMAMNEPAAPITSAIARVIKSDVVYKKGMDQSSGRVRFLLKIGKFEIYTNRKSIKGKE